MESRFPLFGKARTVKIPDALIEAAAQRGVFEWVKDSCAGAKKKGEEETEFTKVVKRIEAGEYRPGAMGRPPAVVSVVTAQLARSVRAQAAAGTPRDTIRDRITLLETARDGAGGDADAAIKAMIAAFIKVTGLPIGRAADLEKEVRASAAREIKERSRTVDITRFKE